MENVLKEKSYLFAIRIVNAYKHLIEQHREYVLSKQLMRSGTSIGANVAEANQAQSGPDFVSKLSIALKECVETVYWLELLKDTDFFKPAEADSLIADCGELRAILISSIKTKKRNIGRE
jgi:four helix bundle protein